MKAKILTLLFLLSLTQNLLAQQKLPVIKATSEIVDIKDDNKLRKKAWSIVPEETLDVYITSAKRVTFYTDIDSISFDIDPIIGEYDFIIQLNGKESPTIVAATFIFNPLTEFTVIP